MRVRRKQGGFTLVEVLIVIAIVGILSAIAAGTYVHFLTKAKLTEGLTLLGPVKTAVAEYHAHHGRMPQSSNWLALLKELGLSADMTSGAGSGEYVERIWWNNSEREIRIRYGFFPITDKLLVLRADVVDGNHLRWQCTTPEGANAVPAIYLPASCRDGAS